ISLRRGNTPHEYHVWQTKVSGFHPDDQPLLDRKKKAQAKHNGVRKGHGVWPCGTLTTFQRSVRSSSVQSWSTRNRLVLCTWLMAENSTNLQMGVDGPNVIKNISDLPP